MKSDIKTAKMYLKQKAVVLFSGGIDSTTALHWALHRAKDVHALTFDYGQRHKVEVRMAGIAARKLGVPRTVLKIDLGQVGGSALTDPAIRLPRFKKLSELRPGPPATYVPFRNGILLAFAAAWAEARAIREIVCGFNVIDSPDYPDTRPEFVRAIERAINAGTKAAFGAARMKIVAPFVRFKKSDIIRWGLAHGVDYSYAVSCYAGNEIPCGTCSSCLLRERAFAEAGARDPLIERLGRRKRP
ncbi:MAG: 7-cyano-7-deazaguanine synthase QueC [Candidatus Aminicenantes bacterium]|nr:7-cyano-7-deazaguanine synthase QueC [Candidatus Aminicenantes bacterium]